MCISLCMADQEIIQEKIVEALGSEKAERKRSKL
jgi:hypothetical protein